VRQTFNVFLASMKPRKKSKPPVALEGCRVEQYAVRHRAMKFAGHGLLFRGDKEVGPVPRLALGRDRSNKVVLLHCDARWNVVGASGDYPNLRAAKKRAERFYPGISKAWVRTGYSRTDANRYWSGIGASQRCSVCARQWYDVERIVEIRKAKLSICDACIRELHAIVSLDDQ
jgi:ClpX C4-type zinc finger